MKKIGKLILPVIAIALLSCASGHHEPFPEEKPIARDLDAFAARLNMLCDGSSLLKLEQAGRIEYKGVSAPIWVVRYRPPGAERRVLITGGVHGNEPAGCAWVGELVGMIAEQPRLYEKAGLDPVPLVNPWGWSRDIRYNREVYTIETPTHLPMEDRLRMHRMAFELIFRGVME